MIPDKYLLEVGAKSETGYVRTDNQDRMSWVSIPWGQLFIVADGMGGHAGGAEAAYLTISGLERHLTEISKNLPVEEAIRSAFEKTNLDVYTKAHAGDPATEGMGSTAVMLLIINHTAKIAHVGDSRAYHYRNGKINLLTKDHTYVQRMVDASMLTPEQARNHPSASMLERAIGSKATIAADINSVSLKEGDSILLCSDGLSGYAEDMEIEMTIDDSLSAQENVDRLINLALQKGGKDNVTIQFLRLGKNLNVYRHNHENIFKVLFLYVLIIMIIIAFSFVVLELVNDPIGVIRTISARLITDPWRIFTG